MQTTSNESGSLNIGSAVDGTRRAAKGLISSQLDSRSTQLGTQINATANDLRTIGREMRDRGAGETAAQLADQLATYVERVGNYLRDADADQLLHDIEQFGRQQPLVFGAGGLILGFAASRVIKLSSSRRYQERYGSGSTSGSGYAYPYRGESGASDDLYRSSGRYRGGYGYGSGS